MLDHYCKPKTFLNIVLKNSQESCDFNKTVHVCWKRWLDGSRLNIPYMDNPASVFKLLNPDFINILCICVISLSDTVSLDGWIVQNLSAHLLYEFIEIVTILSSVSSNSMFPLCSCSAVSVLFFRVKQYSYISCIFFMCLNMDLIIIYCHYYYLMRNWTL